MPPRSKQNSSKYLEKTRRFYETEPGICGSSRDRAEEAHTRVCRCMFRVCCSSLLQPTMTAMCLPHSASQRTHRHRGAAGMGSIVGNGFPVAILNTPGHPPPSLPPPLMCRLLLSLSRGEHSSLSLRKDHGAAVTETNQPRRTVSKLSAEARGADRSRPGNATLHVGRCVCEHMIVLLALRVLSVCAL